MRLHHLVCAFVFSIFVNDLFAQDLIIRIYGDSIHCKVDAEEERFIYYRTASTKRGETEIISRKEVKSIIYGFESAAKAKIGERKVGKSYKSFEVAVQAGYSRILSTDDLYGEDFQNLYDEIRDGPYIDARANYFLNPDFGIGLVYSTSSYESNETILVEVTLPSGSILSGNISHDRTVSYYGFNLAYRPEPGISNVGFQLEAGLGFLQFEDKGDFVGLYNLQSSGIGGHISGSLRLGLGEGFYLPLFLSLKGFNITSFDFTASTEMDPELASGLASLYNNLEGGITMSRLQVGLGLGFSF